MQACMSKSTEPGKRKVCLRTSNPMGMVFRVTGNTTAKWMGPPQAKTFRSYSACNGESLKVLSSCAQNREPGLGLQWMLAVWHSSEVGKQVSFGWVEIGGRGLVRRLCFVCLWASKSLNEEGVFWQGECGGGKRNSTLRPLWLTTSHSLCGTDTSTHGSLHDMELTCVG